MKRILIVLALSFIVILSLVSHMNVSKASEITRLELPASSAPREMVENPVNGYVYLACLGQLGMGGALIEINKTTREYTLYSLPYAMGNDWYGPAPRCLAVDGDGNVWIALHHAIWTGEGNPIFAPVMVKFYIATHTFQYIWSYPSLFYGRDVKYVNGVLWVMVAEGLLKMDYITNAILQFYPLGLTGVDGLLEVDASENAIWISDRAVGAPLEGMVYKFDLATETCVFNMIGFNSPIGMESDGDLLYVAENVGYAGQPIMGQIAVLNETSLEINRIDTAPITATGPYCVYKDSAGYLWFTDGSQHVGIVGGEYQNSGPVDTSSFFMLEIHYETGITVHKELWFSAVGSAFIGIKEVGALGAVDFNKDGIVDIRDVSLVSKAYGAYPGDPRWNPIVDTNADEYIDIKDVAQVSRSYGRTL